MKNKILVSLCMLCALLLNTTNAMAQTATSSSFVLSGLDFDAFGASMSSQTYGVRGGSSGTQNNLGEYAYSNFFTDELVTDFGTDQFMQMFNRQLLGRGTETPAIRMTMSSAVAEMTAPTPGIFGEGELNILVDTTPTQSGDATSSGYSLFAGANTLLINASNGQFIPHTTCDNGCSVNVAGEWQDAEIVGFGYNVTGEDASADFVGEDYFRPFALSSESQPPVMIATQTSSDALTARQTRIRLRTSTPGDMQAGRFENQLLFIALPNF